MGHGMRDDVVAHLLCNSFIFAADPGGWPATPLFVASFNAIVVARRRVSRRRRQTSHCISHLHASSHLVSPLCVPRAIVEAVQVPLSVADRDSSMVSLPPACPRLFFGKGGTYTHI